MDCTIVVAAPVLPVGYVVSARRIADSAFPTFCNEALNESSGCMEESTAQIFWLHEAGDQPTV